MFSLIALNFQPTNSLKSVASKEPTPVGLDAANPGSPNKKTEATESRPLLPLRENSLLKAAMIHCLKSGPLQTYYENYVAHCLAQGICLSIQIIEARQLQHPHHGTEYLGQDQSEGLKA